MISLYYLSQGGEDIFSCRSNLYFPLHPSRKARERIPGVHSYGPRRSRKCAAPLLISLSSVRHVEHPESRRPPSGSEMSNKLYLIDVVVQTYREGADLHGFTERIGAMLAGYSNATRPLHRFKVSGEGRVLAVFEVNNILGLERAVAGLWRMGGVTVSCIPLIPYDAFAQFLGVDLAQTLPSSSSPCQLGDKNLYWLEWAVESRGMDMEQLLAAWKEEASTLLSSRKQGIELDIFKVVAEHKVHIFLSMEDPMEVDKLSFMLPMMQHAGNSVRIQCRAVQSLDDYAKKVMKENL